MSDFVKFHFDNAFFDKPILFSPYSIVQVGDIDTYSGYSCVKHTQVAHEITYIVSGNAVMLCDGKTFFCKTGDLIFSPKGTAHEINIADGHSLRYYYIAFDIVDTSDVCNKKLLDFFNNAKAGCVTADRSIPSAFHDVFLNIYGNDDFSDTIVTDSIRKLLIYALRSLEHRANDVYIPDVRFGKKNTIAQISLFLESNVEDIDALKKLSQKFGYSYSYISSFFSKSMGISLKEYFLISRHRHARELLSDGLSVTETSKRMGYSSIHVFSKAFVAKEGISPSEFSKSLKKQ